MKVICEICTEHIANVDRKEVTIPMKGWMFKSPDTAHGFDPPFLPDTAWEDMRCGYCNQRPFTEEDGFMSDIGYVKIPAVQVNELGIVPRGAQINMDDDAILIVKEDNFRLACDVCGREYLTQQALDKHKKGHKGK